MPGPSKQVKERLTEPELDEAIDEAQSNDEARLVRRLCLVKNLYAGDSVTEAASRVGVTQPTASRWADRWNERGVDGLRPDFGGGRPPKLSEPERERLAEVLERHQPLTTDHVHLLVEDGFGVSYSDRHVLRLLEKLGVRDAVQSPGSTDQSDGAEDQFPRRLRAALDELRGDTVG